ncbi:hypothetical protein SAMN05720761_1311 [Fibrobacter sp. UWCM]|nr:hypothetical protein SAMN05720761_1311 [Fibrobacter sp. UWCM]
MGHQTIWFSIRASIISNESFFCSRNGKQVLQMKCIQNHKTLLMRQFPYRYFTIGFVGFLIVGS